MHATEQEAWESYKKDTLQQVEPILNELGFDLDKTQVHMGGERFLMAGARDVGGGGLKLVLTGTERKSGGRVIIKMSNTPQGIEEIDRERECRTTLHQINFALRAFRTPQELYYGHHGKFVVSITSYIEQERAFIEHSLDEQFFLALRAFETQEGVHATTHQHAKTIGEKFGIMEAKKYIDSFKKFKERVFLQLPEREELKDVLNQAQKFLTDNKATIERYCGFLTHADFVPNNLRVAGRDIFLLDYASIHFGNKYESWARFLNFMIQHNAKLERTLAEYVRTNRGEEEYLSMRLMRVYKSGFLLAFYAEALQKTSGNLHKLTNRRIDLWTETMKALINDQPVPEEVISSYVADLEHLRSEDEKARQREILGGQ